MRILISSSILLSAIFFPFTQGVAEEKWIDDQKLEQTIREKLVEFHEAGDYPDGKTVVRQLRRSPSEISAFYSETKTQDPLSRARNATLIVGHIYQCEECSDWHTNLASGVAISPDGLILTNHHVMHFPNAASFGAANSEGKVLPVTEVISSSKADDLALIRIDANAEIPYTSLAETVRISDRVFIFSHPDSHFYTYTEGVVSRFYLDSKKKTPRIQITAGFARGSSGSGIFDQQGDLVGLVASTRSIHHNEDENQRHLQMVVRSGVPLVSIRRLLGIKENSD